MVELLSDAFMKKIFKTKCKRSIIFIKNLRGILKDNGDNIQENELFLSTKNYLNVLSSYSKSTETVSLFTFNYLQLPAMAKCLQSTLRFYSFYQKLKVSHALSLIKHHQLKIFTIQTAFYKNFLHKKIQLLYLLMSFYSNEMIFLIANSDLQKLSKKRFRFNCYNDTKKNYVTLCWFKYLMDIPLI